MFKVGQKVVCINDEIKAPLEIHNKFFSKWIKKDQVYTVRACTETPMGWGILLEEIRNPAVYIEAYFGKAEPRFATTRFAPLQTNEEFVAEVIKQVTEKEEPVEV